jgi:acyl-homoserine-lactone acylase
MPSRISLSLFVALPVALSAAFSPLLAAAQSAPSSAPVPAPPALAQQVEIRRTTYGVPHIKAENLAAAGYGLAYVQLEDYGANVAMGLLRARGEMARWFGRDSIEGDFNGQLEHARAVETHHLLDAETRAVYEGFAAGVNRYIEMHPAEFPPGFNPRFTAYDVATRDIQMATGGTANRFVARLDSITRGITNARGPDARRAPAPQGAPPDDDTIEEGSNAWAFAPSRTTSGRAILLRNPHLAWSAGYYEGHITVPGVLDFYGDFRIGGPFTVIGGFNRYLGWSTTNNAPDLDEIYSLDVDPDRVDHYLLDGVSLPLERQLVTVEYRNGEGLSSETRERWRTPMGPVIYRNGGMIYILRTAEDGGFRGGEQFLRMMRATSLAEWKDAMRMRARVNSNFTYADRAGNILYLWNASMPELPHRNGGDTTAIHARSMKDMWTRYVNFDSLPQILNPKGGYVHNENDTPWYGNMQQPLDPKRWGPDFPEDSVLDLRSQLAIELIDTKKKLSLEDVVKLKHSYRMLLADRVKPDLISAVRATAPKGDTARALTLMERWDNTSAPDSRGGLLFQTWWQRYTQGTRVDTMFARHWTSTAPATTPSGLANPARAAEAFGWAVSETARRFGAFDTPWGDVHRVRIANVDVPVGGCPGALGCFRVLNFRTDPDGKRAATGGDGWILAVEFGDVPRAYSVLAYGNSNRPESPLYGNQAELFARGELKRVLWLEKDVEGGTVTRYRPGVDR